MSKPVVWRIFRNGKWTYHPDPSYRMEDRALWQPLYAHPSEVEFTEDEVELIMAVRKILAKLAEEDK